MAKVKISGSATGTATYTIQSPSGNTDRTLTLPDEAGTVLTSASDLPAANLTGDVAAARITGALNASGSAPVYACRAWVNFNGTGTVAIRASGNVSSITDYGAGNYQVNFSTAMEDADYSVVGIAEKSDNTATGLFALLNYTSSVRVLSNTTSGLYDQSIVCVSIFR